MCEVSAKGVACVSSRLLMVLQVARIICNVLAVAADVTQLIVFDGEGVHGLVRQVSLSAQTKRPNDHTRSYKHMQC